MDEVTIEETETIEEKDAERIIKNTTDKRMNLQNLIKRGPVKFQALKISIDNAIDRQINEIENTPVKFFLANSAATEHMSYSKLIFKSLKPNTNL